MTPARPPAVLFVSHTASRSGAEAVMMHLVRAAVASGHEVAVASPPGPIVDELPPGVAHVELPALGLSGGSGLRRVVGLARLLTRWGRAGWILRRRLRAGDTRMVVNSLFALPAARLSRPAGGFTWLVHDTVVESKQLMVVRAAAASVRRAVAVSSATAEPLRRYDFPVVVRYNGVAIADTVAPLDHPGRPVVGVLAKLTPWKGHAALLSAVADVPEVDVEFAGDAFPGEEDYVAGLRRQADAPALRGRVRFLGRVDATDCLMRWTALISPSVRPEAGPLNVLEAMSAGCPVIGTDHGGTGEYLADGAGALVAPDDVDAMADAIRRVVGDRGLRAHLASRGRAKVVARHDLASTTPGMLRSLIDD